MREAPYYAEAFSPLPGRCFRMVTDRRPAPKHPAVAAGTTLELRLPRSTVLKRVDRDSTLAWVVLTAEAPGTVQLLLVQQSCGPPL